MFKNAQGKFDGRLFIGVMMGMGSISGVLIKLWWSLGDSVPPFWLWAIPIVFVATGLSAWIHRRREQSQLRERLERSARLERKAPTGNE